MGTDFLSLSYVTDMAHLLAYCVTLRVDPLQLLFVSINLFWLGKFIILYELLHLWNSTRHIGAYPDSFSVKTTPINIYLG